PRKGKPVEINALWHSSLWMVKGLAERFGDRRTVSVVSPLIEASFESFQKFLSVRESQLFDVIEPNDLSMRPNQIFAVSLPNSPLNPIQKRHIFNLVRAKLYTPFGLRSLSPEDKHYHSTYKGDQKQRDEAYHQGMIWPWLLGAFYDAQLAVYPGSESQVLSSLRPIWNSMKRGLGCALSIPELYEPSTLTPAGAISQAWSVAEILRIYTKIKRAKSQPIVDKMPIRYLGVKAV
ncbi:MAG: amylo-alpha-1,6-glucosidase, partial [Candidatus Anstonellaceae archaeon]